MKTTCPGRNGLDVKSLKSKMDVAIRLIERQRGGVVSSRYGHEKINSRTVIYLDIWQDMIFGEHAKKRKEKAGICLE